MDAISLSSRVLALLLLIRLAIAPPGLLPTGSLPAPSAADTGSLQPTALPDLAPGWWEQVGAQIEASEYHLSWAEHTYLPGIPAAYQSPNRRQNLRIYFTSGGDRAGITVIPRRFDSEAAPWLWSLRSNGSAADAESGMQVGPLLSENYIEYRRLGTIESFTNTPDGLIHSIVLPASPTVETHPVRLDLSVSGDLIAAGPPAADGLHGLTAIEYHTPSGDSGVRYGRLQALDAAGNRLPAWLEPQAGGLGVVISAAGAAYPLQVSLLLTGISAAPDWDHFETQTDAMFGFSVAAAGDVTCDGYSDVIIGAPYFDTATADAGKVYAFYGSAAGLQTEIGWEMPSPGLGGNFGMAVASGGDVNGDGCAEVLIGAPNYNWGDTTDSGQAWLYFGAPGDLSTTTWLFAEDESQDNAHFGAAVAFAGDVNGDQYADVLIGEPGYTHDNYQEGRVLAFYGYEFGVADAPNWKAEANQAQAHMGSAVATAGDVNGDGYSDVLVGADGYDDGSAEEGAAFIWYGGDIGVNEDVNGEPTNAAWYRDSQTMNAHFGAALSTAGDVNGDGFADVLIGSPGYTDGEASEGMVWVFHGAAGGVSRTASRSFQGGQVLAQLGRSVFTAGDVNGDGYADIIAGAPGYNAGAGVEGRALLWYGSAAGVRATHAWDDTGENPGEMFGSGAATAGDVNGDGFSDIIVGAPGVDGDRGAAYVYHGGPDGPQETAGFTKRSNEARADFGAAVASAGDVNGDGYADILAGAPLYDGGKIDEGGVWLYHGSSAGPVSAPAWYKLSNLDNAHFGAASASAGDVNRDGYDDIIVGAPGWTSTHVEEGAVFVYTGSADGLNAAPFWSADAAMTGAHFGWSVDGAGDVNCDGYADLLVGAPDFDWDVGGDQKGGAFIYHGAADAGAIDHYWDWYKFGEDEFDWFGYSVSSAGDVDADGCSDIIVGIPGFEDDANFSEGRAEVFLGSRLGLSRTSNWHAESNNFSAQMGFSVASAGDVDGDGRSEVIIGAPYYSDDAGISSEGKVWVFRGSINGVTDAGSWSRESNADTTYYGYSVAGAGDVNGDGYADVIIGAPFDSDDVSDEGTARVYLGSSAGLGGAAPVWFGAGGQVRSWYGRSVAAAGDVNGDGFGDILVGSPKFTDVETEEGRLLLYYGGGGRGVDLRPRQLDNDGSPLAHLGAAANMAYYQVHLRYRSPFGRDWMIMNLEEKPASRPFNGARLWDIAVYVNAIPGADQSIWPYLNHLPGVQYHWRARWAYLPASNPFLPHSRWVHIPTHGWNEPDLRGGGSGEFLPIMLR